MKIMISGSHGLIGSALVQRFSEQGHDIIRIPRSLDDLSFSGVDVIIHLAGEPIAKGRWTAAKKDRIHRSRVGSTHRIARKLIDTDEKPALFLCASAIGYYGNRRDEILNESSSYGTDFLSKVCRQWEEGTQQVHDAGIRTVNLRTGIVLSKAGGALKKMLTPFKFGAGGIMGSGVQYMSWISIDDMINAIDWLIQTPDITGPVNMVAPAPVTNQVFTETLGKVLHRPTILPMPAFAARLLFGKMADALLLSSARVHPVKLLESGYQFKHADLKSALEEILA
jgi:uncharacterized protein (TIGR01777 family)